MIGTNYAANGIDARRVQRLIHASIVLSETKMYQYNAGIALIAIKRIPGAINCVL